MRPKKAGERQVAVLNNLNVKIFADGADLDGMVEMARNPVIKGFTTNPTLMRKAGVVDYERFARAVLDRITGRPVSFEVFADDFPGMIRQGRHIAGWGKNVNVKVPVSTTRGEFTGPVIAALSGEGVALNVTTVFTVEQVKKVVNALDARVPAIVSVFAGRIADTGRDPIPHMMACKAALEARPRAELLWASPREVLNVFQADAMGCDIITCTDDIIAKLSLAGKDLEAYSRETAEMFFRDATAAAYAIEETEKAS